MSSVVLILSFSTLIINNWLLNILKKNRLKSALLRCLMRWEQALYLYYAKKRSRSRRRQTRWYKLENSRRCWKDKYSEILKKWKTRYLDLYGVSHVGRAWDIERKREQNEDKGKRTKRCWKKVDFGERGERSGGEGEEVKERSNTSEEVKRKE